MKDKLGQKTTFLKTVKNMVSRICTFNDLRHL